MVEQEASFQVTPFITHTVNRPVLHTVSAKPLCTLSRLHIKRK